MRQGDWAKAEPFLVRAVKASEEATNNDAGLVLIPLYGLCSLYDSWDKPEEAQPCWHRATELMEKQVGERSPRLADPLSKEATALHRLGRTQEANEVQRRLVQIQQASKED